MFTFWEEAAEELEARHGFSFGESYTLRKLVCKNILDKTKLELLQKFYNNGGTPQEFIEICKGLKQVSKWHMLVEYGTVFTEWWSKRPEAKSPDARKYLRLALDVRHQTLEDIKEAVLSLKEYLNDEEKSKSGNEG